MSEENHVTIHSREVPLELEFMGDVEKVMKK
jgi:hypothetical protein